MKRTILILLLIIFYSCKKTDAEPENNPIIPVTLTSIDKSGIESYVDLNATATFLVKNIIKANATGYLNSVNVQSNDFVNKGKILFTLKTRESKVLGNMINKMDPSLKFGGDIKVHAETSGFVTNVNAQAGDYIQDGDQLAIINDANSFGIVLSLPYELKEFVRPNQELTAFLPDGKSFRTRVQKFMPTVDLVSQTQNVVLKCDKKDIPENLFLKVRIYKKSVSQSVSLPKSAVLSNETETDFWIMKMIDSNTAIKVPIKKGITTDEKIEILSPDLTEKDRILISGNYGVSDTIKVKVIKNSAE